MAIDQLKKGAEVMMLSAELMRDRISSLEKANSAASEPGEDILAQNEADQQIAHEERQEERDQASASGLKGAALE
ncbi:hypothetical protein A1F94_012422 [Pyrenophora tritici-repentis]|nr:hypothetical protein A1F94_012422 [Pyrenophora tritici-repentis]